MVNVEFTHAPHSEEKHSVVLSTLNTMIPIENVENDKIFSKSKLFITQSVSQGDLTYQMHVILFHSYIQTIKGNENGLSK